MTANPDPAGADFPADLPAPVEVSGPAQLDALFPDDAALRHSLRTFVVLLALAAFIASFGLLQDSVAAIIGAMVVAPLGGAIMALAGALVTGRTRYQLITFVEVLLGGLMVVGIGYLVAWVLPDPLTLTPSLDARTAPGVLDLGVALTAGAAGAYVAVRRTGADALPGVAIAVSLVPPLATVGICLEMRRLDDAAGALLLFLTNFSAIVVVACVVFVLCGAGPSRDMLQQRHRLRTGFVVALGALVVIVIPLAWRGVQQYEVTVRSVAGAPIVRDWLGQRDLQVTSWSIDGNHVLIKLTGSDSPAAAAPLAARLAATFGAPVDLEIDYVHEDRDRVSATP